MGYDDYVDLERNVPEQYGPVVLPGFEAKLYLSPPHRGSVSWAAFLGSSFGSMRVPETDAVGALLIARLSEGFDECYAFTFGVLGRYLMREGSWIRGYGLRAALNLIYPIGLDPAEVYARLVSVDTKRRAANTVRMRKQAPRSTTLEAFEVDRLRAALTAATGRPLDRDTWGARVSGGDALAFASDEPFEDLAGLCRGVASAHESTAYREHFGWLDHFQPVADPTTREQLDATVAESLRDGHTTNLDIAPPDFVDWSRVEAFRLPADGRRRERHPDLRLQDVLAALARTRDLARASADLLRRRFIVALDADGVALGRWPIWRCLSGEVAFNDDVYVLDEGDFFRVERSFLRELNDYVDGIATTEVALPTLGPMEEGKYNELAARSMGNQGLLLDRKTVRSSSQTTQVEVCDILTDSRQLIHVKRHLGSSALSHLFSQGCVSAELLQTDKQFRHATTVLLRTLKGGQRFAFFPDGGIAASQFEVAFAIIAHWNGRRMSTALPFFSKVNLRSRTEELRNRGFKVSCRCVDVS